MSSTHRSLLLTGAAFLVAGCGEAGPDLRPGVEIRDSAGVRIVENHGPALGHSLPWRVELEPSFAVGAVEGTPEENLHRVEMVLRLPDGRIAVADRGSNQIRFFHPDGQFSGSIGGSGDGPGEFGTLQWVRRHPQDDALFLAYDMRDGTVLHLDTEGRELARVRIQDFHPELVPAGLEGPGRLSGSHNLIGVFADGGFLSEAFEAVHPDWIEPERGVWDFETLFLHLDRDGDVLGPIARYFRSRHVLDESSGRTLQLPFGPEGRVLPFGNHVLHGDGEEFAVRIFDRDGELVEIWRRSGEPVPLSEEARHQFREASLRSAGHVDGEPESDAVAIRRRLLAQVPWPDHLPAFDHIVPDRGGHLWIREMSGVEGEEGATRTWSVFDGDGRWLGRAFLPAALQVREIGADYILGVTVDDLDVERVNLHRLERSSGG